MTESDLFRFSPALFLVLFRISNEVLMPEMNIWYANKIQFMCRLRCIVRRLSVRPSVCLSACLYVCLLVFHTFLIVTLSG